MNPTKYIQQYSTVSIWWFVSHLKISVKFVSVCCRVHNGAMTRGDQVSSSQKRRRIGWGQMTVKAGWLTQQEGDHNTTKWQQVAGPPAICTKRKPPLQFVLDWKHCAILPTSNGYCWTKRHYQSKFNHPTKKKGFKPGWKIKETCCKPPIAEYINWYSIN